MFNKLLIAPSQYWSREQSWSRLLYVTSWKFVPILACQNLVKIVSVLNYIQYANVNFNILVLFHSHVQILSQEELYNNNYTKKFFRIIRFYVKVIFPYFKLCYTKNWSICTDLSRPYATGNIWISTWYKIAGDCLSGIATKMFLFRFRLITYNNLYVSEKMI